MFGLSRGATCGAGTGRSSQCPNMMRPGGSKDELDTKWQSTQESCGLKDLIY